MTFVPHPLIRCPLDGQPLSLDMQRIRCVNGHSFDIARQGYVNLLGAGDKRSRDPGDSKAMVQARRQFLEAGYYSAVAERLADIVLDRIKDGDTLVDAGCGEAYYLQQLRQRGEQRGRVGPTIIGFDISKWAVQSASRRFDACWLVASNRQIPLAVGASMVTSVFGFPDYESFAKLLPAGGYVVEVSAGPDHLLELRQLIYEEIKKPRPVNWERAIAAGLQLDETGRVRYQAVEIERADIASLLQMTPHMFRASAAGREKVARLQSLAVTVDISINVLVKSGAS